MTNIVKSTKKFILSEEIQMVLTEALVFTLAFILMRVRFIFGVYPFGLAFLASQKKYTPFAFCGCILSVIFLMNMDIAYLVALCGILGLRIIAGLIQKKDSPLSISLGQDVKTSLLDTLFCESAEVRVSICAFCGFGIGIFRVISNNYSYYEIFVLIFLTILLGLLTYSFSLTKKRELPVAYATLVFAILYSLRSVSIFSLSISILLGYALVMYVSKHLGGVKAGALGLLLGLCSPLSFTPIFGIGGLVSGLLWSISPYLAIMSAFALSLGYGVYTDGYIALIELAPELLFVSLIMYPLLRFKMIPVPDFIRENAKGQKSIDTVILETRDKRDKERLSTLTSSFEDIAKLIKTADEKTKAPTRVDYTSLCLECCESFCYGCPKHAICWEKDVSTTENNVNKLGSELFELGQVSTYTVDEKFLHRCPNIENIIEKINHTSKENMINAVKNNKLEVTSYDYEQISRLLYSTQNEQIKEEFIDVHLSEKLERACAKINLVYDEIRVIGRKRKHVIITGINPERTKCDISALTEQIESTLHAKISPPEFTMQGAYATMRTKTVNNFKSIEVFDSKTKAGEEINGDSFVAFEGLSSKKYMLLCDGMGSGRDANTTSSMCTDFLKSILSVTDEKEIAISMLNSLLRAKGLESCSTIDLLEIDLITGKSSFVKSGAAPSYIKRNDKVFKLHSKTMPIGIIKDIDAEELSFELQEGDICIMLSDGIIENNEDSEEMMKLLRSFNDESIDTLPEKILAQAKGRKKSNDDMTACVLKLLAK